MLDGLAWREIDDKRLADGVWLKFPGHEHVYFGCGPALSNAGEGLGGLLTRQIRFSSLKAWGLRIAKGAGFKRGRLRWRASLLSSPRHVEANEPFRHAVAAV